MRISRFICGSFHEMQQKKTFEFLFKSQFSTFMTKSFVPGLEQKTNNVSKSTKS